MLGRSLLESLSNLYAVDYEGTVIECPIERVFYNRLLGTYAKLKGILSIEGCDEKHIVSKIRQAFKLFKADKVQIELHNSNIVYCAKVYSQEIIGDVSLKIAPEIDLELLLEDLIYTFYLSQGGYKIIDSEDLFKYLESGNTKHKNLRFVLI